MSSKYAVALLVVGQLIVRALRAITSKFSKDERLRFVAVQAAFESIAERVKVAEQALREASARAALADEAQDNATRTLAEALAAEGFDRFNPFKVFGLPSPTAISRQDELGQATTLKLLAKKVLEHPDAKVRSRKAAVAAQKTADAMVEAVAAHAAASSEHAALMAERNHSLPEEWRSALAELKAAIRYGDMKEKTKNYDAVFGGLPKARKGKKPVVAPPQ